MYFCTKNELEQNILQQTKFMNAGKNNTNRDATLPLEAPTVSCRHATIDTDRQGHYILRDYSTNGVFVNRQKVNTTDLLSPKLVIN